MGAGTLGATDYFSMGSDWEVQESGLNTINQRATAPKANGDLRASSVFGQEVVVFSKFIYTGAQTTLAAALTAANSGSGCHVGQKPGTYLINQVEVDLDPLGRGERAPITLFGVNGFSADSEIFQPSIDVTLSLGSIPDLLTNSDADSECTSAKYTLQAFFGTNLAAAATILRGATYGGAESIGMNYFGDPTLTTTGWDQMSANALGYVSDYSKMDYAFVKGVSRQ